MMTPSFIRCVCLVVMTTVPTTLGLSGCATPSADDASLSPAEQQLRTQSANFNKTIAEGAGIGALAGALLGGLVSSNHVEGALIGAAAGGVAGGAGGYAVAENNQARAATETSYNDQIDAARASAREFSESARTAQAVADEATAETSRLQAEYASQQISAADYHAALKKYQQDNTALASTIEAAQKKASELRTAAAQSSNYESRQLTTAANNIDESQSRMLEEQQQISAVLEETPGGTGS
jgi:outer membrane lipoprotein SlyB